MDDKRKPYEPNWPHGYETRDGRKARVIYTDAKGSFPVICLVASSEEPGEEHPVSYDNSGNFLRGGRDHAGDLLCCPEPKPVPKEIWVNEYSCGATGYFSKGYAESQDPSQLALRLAVKYREVIED